MGFIILILIIIGLLTLAISFFKKDRIKQLEKQIEDNSITMMQELYKVKKKVRILEEEVMLEERDK
ncbi:hypothetical protein QS257_08990 [Terrilactibacillus sp. S3-3]|nr:hypothetical protein QS257_08990 [Terrilactibacillus sp. S3-3]